MIEPSWDFTDIDAVSRERALEEAERRGVSLADYLTEVVLQAAVEPAPPVTPPPLARTEALELRHRVDALDRRLSTSVGGLDAAVHAVDASVGELGDRLLGAEKSIAENAEETADAVQGLTENLTAVRRRLGEAEDALGVMRAGVDRDVDAITRKIDVVSATVNANAGAVNKLEQAHERLQHALAEDFSAFAQDTAEQLQSGLDAARAAAQAAAEHADLAAGRLAQDLAELSAALDQGLEDSASNARALVQAAFEDAADRILALAQGLSDVDRRQARRADQLQASIADTQSANKAAMQQTAASLRQADAELAALVARNAKDAQAAVGAMRDSLNDELSELRQQQAGSANRLERVAADVAENALQITEIDAALQGGLATLESKWDGALKGAGESWEARLDVAAAQLGVRQHSLHADLERVELSTIAALEALSSTMRERDADLDARLTLNAAETGALIARVEAHLEGVVARTEEQQANAVARIAEAARASEAFAPRLAVLEASLHEQAHAARAREQAFTERLTSFASADDVAMLEARLGKIETTLTDAKGGDALRKRLDALAAQVASHVAATSDNQGLAQRLEELRARLAPIEAQAGEAASGMQGVARMLGRLTTQNADSAAQAEKRLSKLEKAVAEVHLDRLRERDTESDGVLEARLKAFEERHETALAALRAEIAHFISENERRLAAVERGELPGGEDLAAAFDTLRRRMDERVADVEQRSARALEQVADTVALIERRFVPTRGA